LLGEKLSQVEEKLRSIPLVSEERARACAEVYHDGSDTFEKPFEGDVKSAHQLLEFVATYGYWGSAEKPSYPVVADLLIAAALRGNMLVTRPLQSNLYYVVRVGDNCYLCYKGTTYRRGSSGYQDREPQI
jgi:hypothetical protein